MYEKTPADEPTVATELDAGWIFVVDHLNTHRSETPVLPMANLRSAAERLNASGEVGVLGSEATRRASLEDADHRVRFVFTPWNAS